MSYYNYDTGYFRGYCVRCGTAYAKRDLDRILVRNGRYGPTKTMAYICRDCLPTVSDFLGVDLPDVDTSEYQRTPNYPYCPACCTYGMEGDRFCRKCGEKLEKRKRT